MSPRSGAPRHLSSEAHLADVTRDARRPAHRTCRAPGVEPRHTMGLDAPWAVLTSGGRPSSQQAPSCCRWPRADLTIRALLCPARGALLMEATSSASRSHVRRTPHDSRSTSRPWLIASLVSTVTPLDLPACREELDPALGDRPRFVIPDTGGQRARIGYLRPRPRRPELGPLRVAPRPLRLTSLRPSGSTGRCCRPRIHP
jgi:hypothetical protein